MRSFRAPSTFASAIGLLSLSTQISATPFWWPSDVSSSEQASPTNIPPYEEPHNVTLELRACANPCGWYGQLCCQTGETCYTDANNQAQCGSGSTITSAASGGYWQYYTSTWVESQAATHTTVWSSYFAASVTAAATAISCNYALNQSPCGSICCSSGQYCASAGTCAAAGGGSSEGSGGTAVVVGGTTATASAALRPTTGTVVVSTASATTTLPFSTPVATGANVTLTGTEAQSSGGLSGGAIAGIVIGVILGLALLFLLCFCLCVRGLFGLFGGKKQKKGRVTETEYIEEYHHHSGGSAAVAGGAAGAAGGRRWYGDRPASRPPPPKKAGGIGGLGATAAGLGALAIALGLKRKHDKKQAKTEYTGSSYEYSYYGTSDTSSSSDDRRTRRSSRH